MAQALEKWDSKPYDPPSFSILEQLVISMNRRVTKTVLSDFVKKDTLVYFVQKVSQMEKAFSGHYRYSSIFKSKEDREKAEKKWDGLQKEIGWKKIYVFFCKGFYHEMKYYGIDYWDFCDDNFIPPENLPDEGFKEDDRKLYQEFLDVYKKTL